MKVFKQISVLLVDDNAPIRQGLRTLLGKDKRICILGEASNGREAVEMAHKLRPKVILMDISMPILNGLEATRQVMAERPSTKIIVLSAHVDEEYVERAKAVGAAGYLAKQMSAADLTSVIHEVVAGRRLFDSVGSKIFSGGRDVQPERGGAAKGKSETLTHRESEVLDLMAGGVHKTKIASKLRISRTAVESHFNALMGKLSVPSIANLAAYAIASGYIENDVDLTIT